MLYYENPYLKEIEVEVLEREGNRYFLSDTILYPGGGGQPQDHGTVFCENGSFPIRHIGEGWHEVEGNCKGKQVKILLDWERRYLLMRSHSAEHTFFRILENMGARMGKIALGEVSSIIFQGEIEINDILKAERETRKLIREGRKVRSFWIKKDELSNYPQLRIKLERIRDELIRVVEIEGHDLSACKGIHVSNLKEIGDFAIVGIRMGKTKEVKFVIGERAWEHHTRTSELLRKIIWARNLEVNGIEKYLENLENENEKMLRALKELSKTKEFNIERCGGVELHYFFFPYGDYKIIQRRAMEIANHSKAIVFYGIGEKNIVCIAYNPLYEWAGELYLELLRRREGRGGGKGNFLSGSDRNPEEFISELKNIICEKAIQLHGDENGSD